MSKFIPFKIFISGSSVFEKPKAKIITRDHQILVLPFNRWWKILYFYRSQLKKLYHLDIGDLKFKSVREIQDILNALFLKFPKTIVLDKRDSINKYIPTVPAQVKKIINKPVIGNRVFLTKTKHFTVFLEIRYRNKITFVPIAERNGVIFRFGNSTLTITKDYELLKQFINNIENQARSIDINKTISFDTIEKLIDQLYLPKILLQLYTKLFMQTNKLIDILDYTLCLIRNKKFKKTTTEILRRFAGLLLVS